MLGPDRQGTPEGLTSAKAAEALRHWGPNELTVSRRFEAIARSWRGSSARSSSSCSWPSAVSAALGQLVSSIIIALLVLLGVALDFAQAVIVT